MLNKFRIFIWSALLFAIIFLCANNSYAWGEKGHKLINKKAMDYLPDEMKDFRVWGNYLGDHAADADKRKGTDKTEGPKHFIDIDFYPEFLLGKMIQDKDSLIGLYGEETVEKMGYLPWATVDTYKNLVKAFKEGNRDRALIFASDLGHYVADGHQPMHTVMNYNGQLTKQKGVHARYEVRMVDRYLSEIENSFGNCKIAQITDPLAYAFNYITNANSVSDILFVADNFSTKKAGDTTGDEYYRLLWYKTNYVTKVQFNKAAQDLASFVYTAWSEAGKPDFSKFN